MVEGSVYTGRRWSTKKINEVPAKKKIWEEGRKETGATGGGKWTPQKELKWNIATMIWYDMMNQSWLHCHSLWFTKLKNILIIWLSWKILSLPCHSDTVEVRAHILSLQCPCSWSFSVSGLNSGHYVSAGPTKAAAVEFHLHGGDLVPYSHMLGKLMLSRCQSRDPTFHQNRRSEIRPLPTILGWFLFSHRRISKENNKCFYLGNRTMTEKNNNTKKNERNDQVKI